MRSLLIFLDTQSWAKRSRQCAPPVIDSDNEDEIDDDGDDSSLVEIKESVDHIATHFRVPLEAKGVLLATL